MYAIPSMIEMGLKEGQEWPSPFHEEIAIALVMGNPNITTKDMLAEVVQSVLTVPKDRIETITIKEIRKEFKCPI